jgi:ATP-binding cassette, subfamily F, member 3
MHMVPAIRNILGGFLFSGDDVYKPVAVLSGGERTRLAVARMRLRPSNTLLLDEPTNHLDLDSKDVLLDALADYGGTLVFVSHDRYFVDRLATKVIEVGGGTATVYPGTYEEFLWKKERRDETPAVAAGTAGAQPAASSQPSHRVSKAEPVTGGPNGSGDAARAREAKKQETAEARRRDRAARAHQARIEQLEGQISDRERALKEIEASMAAPGFYEDLSAAQPLIDRHQALMWEVGDLMHKWEELQTSSDAKAPGL